MRRFEVHHGHTALLVDDREVGTQVTVSHEGRGVTIVLSKQECDDLAAALLGPLTLADALDDFQKSRDADKDEPQPCAHDTRARTHYARHPDGRVLTAPSGQGAVQFGAAGTEAPTYLGLLCDPCAIRLGLLP